MGLCSLPGGAQGESGFAGDERGGLPPPLVITYYLTESRHCGGAPSLFRLGQKKQAEWEALSGSLTPCLSFPAGKKETCNTSIVCTCVSSCPFPK